MSKKREALRALSAGPLLHRKCAGTRCNCAVAATDLMSAFSSVTRRHF